MNRSTRERMQADLVAAMRGGDRTAVAVLRTTLAAVSNAEAVDPAASPVAAGLFGDVERRSLTDADVQAIVARELDELSSAAAELDQAGRQAEAGDCRARASVLAGYVAA